jgi:tetratricopeptide (TPR) repeat protein
MRGKFDEAIDVMNGKLDDLSLERGKPLLGFAAEYAYFLSKVGQFDEAEEWAELMKETYLKRGQSLQKYWYAKGNIELNRGNYDLAASYFDSIYISPHLYERRYLKALAYYKNDDMANAVDNFVKLQNTYNSPRSGNQIFDVLSYYYLGMAYEKSQWFDRALIQYETFEKIWENADPELKEKYNVKDRIERLKTRM